MKTRAFKSITDIQRKSSRPEEAFTVVTISALKILKICKNTVQADLKTNFQSILILVLITIAPPYPLDP